MISKDEVKHIAHLARVELTADELERIGSDLSKILEYVDQLDGIDTADVAPLNGGTNLMNAMRADAQTEESKKLCNPEESAFLVNSAPAKERGYVKVKSVF
ncbi:MAG: Asp-tRNA(Asn)/Glu-tRNA(Gln) amidotransferase subunit GatC [Patescibacteria group bacterium]